MKKEKTIEETFQKLSHRDHIRKRPARYINDIHPSKTEMYLLNEDKTKFEKRTINFSPGFQKLFNEPFVNPIDEAERKGSNLDTIKVWIDEKKKTICIEDNGGIPVVIHKTYNEYVPEMIFGHLMAGSNFDDSDERTGIGQNGEGVKLTNVFSSKFVVETDDGKKHFKMTWIDGMLKKSKAEITPSKKKGTSITYTLDSEIFDFSKDYVDSIIKMVYDTAGVKSNIKIYLDGKLIKIKSFKDYIKFYTDNFLFESNDNWEIGIAPSENGEFEHFSFVNGSQTIVGGTHVDYVSNQIVNNIKEWIWKKKKYDIKPGEIKNHLRLFINSTIVNPKFNSQTKEKLVTKETEFKTDIKISDKFINSIIKSEIIQSILDWIDTKEKQKELAELRKLNKEIGKDNPKRIVKLSDASSATERDKCALCIVEGLSASLAITSSRDPKYIGSYALKGKIPNVSEIENKKIVDNQEIREMMTAIGLKIGEPVKSIKDLRYGRVYILTDADPDGAGHITGLLCNFFYRFWPELFKMNFIYRFYTPIVKAIVGKENFYFNSIKEFEIWEEKNKNKNFKSKWLKGLASSTTEDFRVYLKDIKNLVPLEYKDKKDFEVIELFFDKDKADLRKEYLGIMEK
jgi:DNA topoisomerase-2